MEELSLYLSSVLNSIPKEVTMCVFIIIFATEGTKDLMTKLEEILEEKKGKQIKFFDHTKVLFVVFWALLGAIVLAWGKIIDWKMLPLYFIGMYGASTLLYESVVKKIGKLLDKN